jgi:hypothetical protein
MWQCIASHLGFLANQALLYLFNRGAAAQPHGQLEIFAQDIQDTLGALLSIDSQAPD